MIDINRALEDTSLLHKVDPGDRTYVLAHSILIGRKRTIIIYRQNEVNSISGPYISIFSFSC